MTAPQPDPTPLHDRALQDLSFIRRTMEGAASFTDVPGKGIVALGLIAIAAAAMASRQPTPDAWLTVWLVTGLIGGLVGSGTMYHKMRQRVGTGAVFLLSAPARKFFLGYWPALLAGAILTVALIDPATPGVEAHVTARLLPGVWLLLYGVGVTTAGAHSVRAVPLMGIGFILLGTTALFCAALDGNLMLALGFGALHIGFGVHIARRHCG